MSRSIDLTYLNGEFLPRAEARISVEDRGFQFGESLFEIWPITAGEPRFLPKHYERLASGIRWMELENGVPDQDAADRICRELIERTGIVEGTCYFQITGGSRPRNYKRISPPPVTVVAYVIPFLFPRAAKAAQGIAAITALDPRWAHPVYKTTMLLGSVMQKREAARQGADEVILHHADGTLHEGASSSVFLIKHKTLIEPETDGKVLPGTTSLLAIEAAQSLGLRFETRPVQVAELFDADEVLLTATSRLAMGIHTIDDRPIGTSEGSGPWTCRLAAALRERYGLLPG